MTAFGSARNSTDGLTRRDSVKCRRSELRAEEEPDWRSGLYERACYENDLCGVLLLSAWVAWSERILYCNGMVWFEGICKVFFKTGTG